MKVSYRLEETDAGAVLRVFDDIDLTNANMLADALFSAIDARRGLIIDVRGLRYIDSVGLHILLRAWQRAERLGCALTLVAARPTLQLVERFGLNRLMPVVADLAVSHEVRGPRRERPTEPSKTES